MNLGQKRLPLKALHAFEAVGRHLNMGQAASELSVTQSAISHQIRHAEELWELKRVLPARKICKPNAIQCSNPSCDLVACSLWVSKLNGTKWYSCMDCQGENNLILRISHPIM